MIRLEGDAVVLLDQTRLPGERVDRRCSDRAASCARRSASSRSAAPRRSASRRRWGWRRPRAARRAADTAGAARGARGRARAAGGLAADGGQPRLGARSLRRGHRAAPGRRTSCARRSPTLARRIHDDEVARCLAMGRHGAELLSPGARVLTHCNAGALATGGYGSALGVVRAAHARDPGLHVWVDETRPLLQGARLTAWELAAGRHPAHADRRRRGRAAVRARAGRRRRLRRRSHRAQRRRGEQDRLVHALGARARPRRALLRRGAVLDDRSRDRERRGDPDRGARRGRGRAPRRARAARPRAPPSRIPPSTSRRRPTSRRS